MSDKILANEKLAALRQHQKDRPHIYLDKK